MTEQPIATDIYAEAFFTADHGAVENGKLYVNGGFWNRLGFPSYPAVTPFPYAPSSTSRGVRTIKATPLPSRSRMQTAEPPRTGSKESSQPAPAGHAARRLHRISDCRSGRELRI